MKINNILILSIALISSTNCLAAWQFQGKGRVVSEHTSLSGNAIDGGIIEKNISLTAPKSYNSRAEAFAVPTTGTMGSIFNAMGQHSVYVKNTTMSAQLYKYYYELCADNTSCFNYTGSIELAPGAVGENKSATFVSVQYYSKGTYNSQASTRLVGEQTAFTTHGSLITVV